MRAPTTVMSVRPHGGGLRVRLEAQLVEAGVPLRFVRRGDRVLCDGVDVTDELSKGSVRVFVRSRDAERTSHRLPAKTELRVLSQPGHRDAVRVVLSVDADIDPATAAAGAPLAAGEWDVRATTRLAGFTARATARRHGRAHALTFAVSPGGAIIERRPTRRTLWRRRIRHRLGLVRRTVG